MSKHDKHLRRVIKRLDKYNATVRAEKCVIRASEVEFNGHRISASAILPLTSNVNALMEIHVPNNQKQLLRSMCTATYYLKFVLGFASMAKPLRRLLKKDVVSSWTPECQPAFDEIKQAVVNPLILAHFNTLAETIVACDAFGTALGACLSQLSADGQHVFRWTSDLPETIVVPPPNNKLSVLISATEQWFVLSVFTSVSVVSTRLTDVDLACV